MQNPICWFELPVIDIERAARFYEEVFAISLRRESCGGHPLAVFPYEAPQPSGALDRKSVCRERVCAASCRSRWAP